MTDFENTPLRDDETGEIIRTANGKPVLYKHFLNDLPDKSEEIYSNMSAIDQAATLRGMGVEVSPQGLKEEAEELKKIEEEKKRKKEKEQ